jgi:hypothetical protein
MAEPDFPEEVMGEGHAHQLLDPIGPGELLGAQVPEDGAALVEQVTGAGVLVLEGLQAAEDTEAQGGAQLVSGVTKQWQALLEQRLGRRPPLKARSPDL